jgi:Leucine-rich repeat (LRR) protein
MFLSPSQNIGALELLFNSTRGNQWSWRNEATNGPKWSFSSPQVDPCSDMGRVWQGITCSSAPNICELQSCEIVSLSLNAYNLNGTLPSQFFVQLPSLRKLEISSSVDLVGSIPSEVGSLSQLSFLSLYNNQLIGALPSEIGCLSQLDGISLYNNQLTGVLPSEIGSLSKLVVLYLHNNQLTGAIPSEIGALSQLIDLYLYNNQLVGAVPSEIGSLSQLSLLFLDDNQLTGSIPPEIGYLSQLVGFSLDNNHLTGAIPSKIGSLSLLDGFSLSNNQLTGGIPSEIGSLSRLGILYILDNYLTGAIPSEIGSLTKLGYLSLDNNQLTGSISFEIGSLSRLDFFSLYNNRLTGTIPSEIGSLSRLSILSLSYNQLTGTIPSEIGSLSKLASLSIDNNQLTGTIPSSFSGLVALVNLHLYQNHLKGPITFSLTSFLRLQQLFLQQNLLTGSLHLLFFSSSTASLFSSELLNLDVSDNLLSGSIPSTLFLAPLLQSISLSLNCFEHELPTAICQATGATVISMDGLGSAEGCQNVVTLPFTSVSLVRSMDGSIPECVWSMSNLRMLNLAGNGFEGRIGLASSMSSLLSLTLSHNYLSGGIPLWLQKKSMLHLDLSHNKLTGDVDGFNHQASNNSSLPLEWGNQSSNKNLTLSVNRLSGDLPSSFGKYADLDILSGNLFGCDHLPKNDENSESLSCGSEQYDQSMITMGGLLGMVVCLVAIYHVFCMLFTFHKFQPKVKRRSELGLLIDYVRYYQSDPLHQSDRSEIASPPDPFPHPHLQSIASFGSLLASLMWASCVLTTLCFFFTLPVYVLKQLDVESASEGGETRYVTHTYMYNWLWTMAFLSGTTPAIILLVTGFACLSYFNVFMNHLGSNGERPSPLPVVPSSPSLQSVTNNQSHFIRITAVWTIFFVNIAVVVAVNGLYIWSTLHDFARDVRLLIQLSFALFSSLWSVCLRRGLPSQIKESRYGVWLFICLNAMNSVLIPCAVTALSTPSCYQVSVLVSIFRL